MDSAPSDGTPRADRTPRADLAAFKIVIAGGFGAGKTTLVGAISEVRPLRTEESLSTASVGLDDLSGVDSKATTTVAMDFGRYPPARRLLSVGRLFREAPGAVPRRRQLFRRCAAL
jgi:hypothetical protein